MPPDVSQILTVTQLALRVKQMLEAQVGDVWVAGEISNWRPSPAGHVYFTLKDADGEIQAVMFRHRMTRVKFQPGNGMEVIVHGQVTLYEKRGTYQIVCDEMNPRGIGALQIAFERLKKKLESEGLFAEDHKKPLPLLPRSIGIVTSPTGAAIRDMLNVLQRRFDGLHVLLYPARVQGEEAPPEIVAGIRALDKMGVDLIIVGRGGGSLEDLWAFNEEMVVRAVYEATTPIISAVGHEIDFTLCDFAADLRAPTPSAAAELAVREREALAMRLQEHRRNMERTLKVRLERLRQRIVIAGSVFTPRRATEILREPTQQVDDFRMRLHDAMEDRLAHTQRRLEAAGRALALLSPAQQVQRARARQSELRGRMGRIAPQLTDRARARMQPLAAKLDVLSPLAILGRGYALARTWPDGELIKSADQVSPGNEIQVSLGKGHIIAAVERIEE